MILVDSREPWNKAVDKLDKYGVDYRVDALDHKADYVVISESDHVRGKDKVEIGVQRKEVNDFIGSIGDLKDTMYQVREHHDASILLLEKRYRIDNGRMCVRRGNSWYPTDLKIKSFRNFIMGQFMRGTFYFHTINFSDTIKTLVSWESYLEGPVSPPTSNSSPSALLTIIPGVGPKTASKILDEYRDIFSAICRVDEWEDDINGIGPKSIEKINDWAKSDLDDGNNRSLEEYTDDSD